MGVKWPCCTTPATNLAAHLAAKVDAGRLTGADLFFLAFKASRY